MTRQSQLMIAGIATGVLVLALLAAQFLGPNQAAPSAVTSPPASRPPDAATSSPIESPAPAVPAFRHVYLIIMENQEYSSIVGNAAAPYINSLIEGYGLAAEYHGVAHPSQPNYFALFSGSTQGVTDNDVHDLEVTHLADQLDAAGRTWSVFAENVPLGCFTGAKSSGGPDGSGEYVRKHEPAISFTNIATDPQRCGRITNLSHFDAAAAS